MIDPDGRAPDWIKNRNSNGSVTYTAEQGDSAMSLFQQHGVPLDQADRIVRAKFGPNVSTGLAGPYADRSTIHPGDQVTVPASGGGSSSEDPSWLQSVLGGVVVMGGTSDEGDFIGVKPVDVKKSTVDLGDLPLGKRTGVREAMLDKLGGLFGSDNEQSDPVGDSIWNSRMREYQTRADETIQVGDKSYKLEINPGKTTTGSVKKIN